MRTPMVPHGLLGDFIVVLFRLSALLEVMALRYILKPLARNDPDAVLKYELQEMVMLDVFRNGLPRG